MGQNLRPLESNLTCGSLSAVSDRLITVCVGGLGVLSREGLVVILWKTSVEVFLMVSLGITTFLILLAL